MKVYIRGSVNLGIDSKKNEDRGGGEVGVATNEIANCFLFGLDLNFKYKRAL
jgi:hypothetical protein